MNPLALMILTTVVGLGTSPSGGPSAPLRSNLAGYMTLSDSELRSQVRDRLATIDTPIADSSWRSLGPRAVPVLRGIVQNHDNLPTQRAKAIDGWAALQDAGAVDAFHDLALAASEPVVVRFAALRAMSALTDKPKLPTLLAPVLSGADDSRVRAYAAEVLVRGIGVTGCPAVRQQALRENESVREQFGHALALCSHP